jgi:hypothetical protein
MMYGGIGKSNCLPKRKKTELEEIYNEIKQHSENIKASLDRMKEML